MRLVKLTTTIAIAFTLAATAAIAQTHTVESGKTTVTLSSGFVSALQSLHVTAGTIGPTSISGGVASFPVVAGAFDVNNAKGEIIHSGGLTLADSAKRVRLQSYTIDTAGTVPMITCLVTVHGVFLGRMPLFDLQLPSGLKFPLQASGDVFSLKGVGVKLDAAVAKALNMVFGVSAFQGGFNVGTANVTTVINSDSN